MQAVDTNLLVRLFVADEPAQAQKVRALFDQHADEDGALWVADIVLVELVWALDRVYARPRAQIAAAVQALAGNATVQLESAAGVREAVALYAAGPADFADCLLAVKAAQAGCDALRSFDKKMRGLPGFKSL
jgi:predicted nucleic-acid-binding protein